MPSVHAVSPGIPDEIRDVVEEQTPGAFNAPFRSAVYAGVVAYLGRGGECVAVEPRTSMQHAVMHQVAAMLRGIRPVGGEVAA